MSEELEGVDKRITSAYGRLMDLNTAIVKFSREQIANALKLAEAHSTAADLYQEIADLHVEGAQQSADLLADAITHEFGISAPPEEDREDDDDDDE